MPTLSMSDIVNVVVSASPAASVRNGFNMGLIVGTSTVISAATRVKTYASITEMVADGFATNSAEYLAAVMYFGQSQKPQRVAIGRWDVTGSETALQAVTDCRVKNTDWYACTVCGNLKAAIISIAAYIESCVPVSAFFYTTSDAEVLAGTAGNVMIALNTSGYRRTLGQFSSTTDAVAAIMGYAMGAMTGLANSAYTLALKAEVGVTAQALTTANITTLQGYNGNYYINRGTTYNLFENGLMANGTPFDEVINLDSLANDIQRAVMDTLTSNPKVPQTEEGVALLCNAITSVCDSAVTTGFVAAGKWTGAKILNVDTNYTLSRGYLVIADMIANQSSADRALRKAPPIYVLIKLAGAVQSAVINVYVNT